jgi:hypothetical protein
MAITFSTSTFDLPPPSLLSFSPLLLFDQNTTEILAPILYHSLQLYRTITSPCVASIYYSIESPTLSHALSYLGNPDSEISHSIDVDIIIIVHFAIIILYNDKEWFWENLSAFSMQTDWF